MSLQTLENQLSVVNEEKSSLETDLSAVKKALLAEMAKHKKEMKKVNEKKSAELKNQKKALMTYMQSEMKDLSAKVSNSEDNNSNMVKTFEEMKVNMEQKEMNLKQAHEKETNELINRCKRNCEEYGDQIKDLKQQYAEVTKILSQERQTSKKYRQKLYLQESQLNSAADDLKRLERQYKSLKHTNLSLEAQLKFVNAELRQFKNLPDTPSGSSSMSRIDPRSIVSTVTNTRTTVLTDISNDPVFKKEAVAFLIPNIPTRSMRLRRKLDDSLTSKTSIESSSSSDSNVSVASKPKIASFKVEEEEESEFMCMNLVEDRKAGRCDVKESGRLSELSRRNTLCPPHLKTSYPVETQANPIQDFTDDHLKGY